MCSCGCGVPPRLPPGLGTDGSGQSPCLPQGKMDGFGRVGTTDALHSIHEEESQLGDHEHLVTKAP